MKKFYYWQNFKRDVENFVARCLDCKQVKPECKNLGGLLQPIQIPIWKWEVISINFITSLLRTSRQCDSIMVVMEKMNNVAHFILMKTTYSDNDVA